MEYDMRTYVMCKKKKKIRNIKYVCNYNNIVRMLEFFISIHSFLILGMG